SDTGLRTSNSPVSTNPPAGERDYTLDKVENLCPLRANGSNFIPKYSLGDMEKLPLELLTMIFTELDPHSLMNFRRVNKLAFLSVESVPQYKRIVKYAPTVLRSVNSIGPGQTFSLQYLHDKLYTIACEACGDYGGFLYLIICRRVCALCFTRTQSYLPLLQADVLRKFALRPKDLASLPKIKSIPGYYCDIPYTASK
ncbi:hypothetical protein BJY00DRAFT_320762, partial [Aspergillus carlsbadensis]